MDVISQGRSSYFHVKDPQALRNLCAEHNEVKLLENDKGFAIICEEGIPTEKYDENGNSIEFDVIAEIADMLVDGESIIYEEISYEGSRSIGAWSTAKDNRGNFVNVDLTDIQHKMVAAGMALPKKLDY